MSTRAWTLCVAWVMAACGPAGGGGSPSPADVTAAIGEWGAAHRALSEAVETATEAELARAQGLDAELSGVEPVIPPDILELADSWVRAYASLPHAGATGQGGGDGEFYALPSTAYDEKLRVLQSDLDAAFEFQKDERPAVKAEVVRARTLALAEDYEALRKLDPVQGLPIAKPPAGAEDRKARFDRLCAEGARAFAQSSARERRLRAEARLKVEHARASLLAAEMGLEALLLKLSPAAASALLAGGAAPTPAAAAAELAEWRAQAAVHRAVLPAPPSGNGARSKELAVLAELLAGFRGARDVWEQERAALDEEKVACGTVECEVLLVHDPFAPSPIEERNVRPLPVREHYGPSRVGRSSPKGEDRRLFLEELQRENELAQLRKAKATYIETKRAILFGLEGDGIPRAVRSIATPRGRLVQEDLHWVEAIHRGFSELEAAYSETVEAATRERGQLERARVEHRTKEFQVRIAAMLHASAQAAD